MYQIDIHADDYGLSVSNAKILNEAIMQGQLDSVSIIPTMDDFDDCMELLRGMWDSFPKKPLITVHIDLVDGVSQSDSTKLIETSWGSLFIASFLPGRRKLCKNLALEIKAQIERVVDALPELGELRLDSHMHTHMIPVVADAMWMAYEEYKADCSKNDKKVLPLTFVRIAREPMIPFFKHSELYKTYSPINFVKNIILNVLSPRIEKQCRKNGIDGTLLWGLIMTGHMDYDRVSACYDDVTAYAKKKDKYMEILFHPAGIELSEKKACHNKDDVSEFYFSSNRMVELDAIRKLNKV